MVSVSELNKSDFLNLFLYDCYTVDVLLFNVLHVKKSILVCSKYSKVV
jgi:hypothetical protein